MISGEGENESPLDCALVASTDDDEPKYKFAISGPESAKWKEAISKELLNLKTMKVFEPVDRPPNRKIVRCRFVLKRKRDANGTISRYKARLVACGYSQEEGIDYQETFAPVARLNTFFILLSAAASKGWHIHQMDIDCAYLNAPLKEEIYMEAPKELGLPSGKVLKLNKALYGLKQAGREWHDTFSTAMIKLGWERCAFDPCLFSKNITGQMSYILIYVDDILVIGETFQTVTKAKELILSCFSAKDQGEAHFILGMEISRNWNHGTLSVRQKALISKYMEDRGLTGNRKAPTPIPKGWKPTPNAHEPDTATVKRFQKGIGELLYLARCTRPDISAAVNLLSRFASNPSAEHEEALERVFKYVNSTANLSLKLGGKDVSLLLAYSDADWAEDKQGRKSTSGYILTLGKAPIAWRSCTQKSVAISTCEAEYVALSECIRELIWAKQLIEFLGLHPKVKILCDNESAIASIKNPVNTERLKHIDIRFHFARDYIKEEAVDLEYVRSEANLADIFTKPLDKGRHHNLRQALLCGNGNARNGEC